MRLDKINDVLRQIQDGGSISTHELDQLIRLIDETCQEPHEAKDTKWKKPEDGNIVDFPRDSSLEPVQIKQMPVKEKDYRPEPVQTKQALVKEKEVHKIQDNMLVVEFLLGSQHFAIDLFKTKEIINVPEITSIPDAPSYVLGMFDLRGTITKVLDLRSLIHMQPEDSKRAHIIVLDCKKEALGLLVDNVLSVVSYQKDKIAFDDAGETNSNRLGVIRRIKEDENRGNTELTVLLNLKYILKDM